MWDVRRSCRPSLVVRSLARTPLQPAAKSCAHARSRIPTRNALLARPADAAPPAKSRAAIGSAVANVVDASRHANGTLRPQMCSSLITSPVPRARPALAAARLATECPHVYSGAADVGTASLGGKPRANRTCREPPLPLAVCAGVRVRKSSCVCVPRRGCVSLSGSGGCILRCCAPCSRQRLACAHGTTTSPP